MTTEVRIFDPRGYPIADPRVSTTRSWILNDIGDCSFTISTSDPDCTDANLRFGNILVVNHDKLPPWVGFIDSGGQARKWTNGEVEVYATSAEKILDWRYTKPLPFPATNSGAMIKLILDYQNRYSPAGIEIQEGYIYTGGQAVVLPKKPKLSDIIRKFSKSTGNDWSVTHELVNGRVNILFNWYRGERGTDTQKTLNAINTKGGTILYSEDGEIANDVVFMSAPKEDGSIKYSKPARDEKSIGRYGLRQYVGEGVGSDPDGLWLQALIYLYDHAYPKGKVEPTILDYGDIFTNVALGNRYLWESHAAPFGGSGLGVYEQIRMMGFEAYDDANEVNATVEINTKPFDVNDFLNRMSEEI